MIRYEKSILARTKNRGDRKLLVWGDDYLSEYAFRDACQMGLDCVFCADRDLLAAFPQANAQDHFILVPVYTAHKDFYEYLIDHGFRYDLDFTLMNIGGFCRALNAVDPLLAYTRDYQDIPQYDVLGEGKLKIMLLGSSTSDLGEAGQKCWPCWMYDALTEMGIDCTVYAGAVAGYCSGQEALKLFRDINTLKPDLVLSYSGVNDVGGGTHLPGHPLVNRYQNRMWNQILSIRGTIPDSLDMRNIQALEYGPRDDNSSASEVWVNHQKKMQGMCQAFHIPFLTVLEPFISCGCVIEPQLQELLEKGGVTQSYYDGQLAFVREVKEAMKDLPYFRDLSEGLSGETCVFLDSMHYNEKGQRIMGKKVADLIVQALK